MSRTASSSILYGISFPEDTKFPWGDDCFDDWIIEKMGFVCSIQPPDFFDDNGNWKDGITEKEKKEYDDYLGISRKEENKFLEKNPIKLKLVREGSYDFGESAICLKDTLYSTDWDNNFLELNKDFIENFRSVSAGEIQYVIDFVTAHIKPFIEENKSEFDEDVDYTTRWLWGCFYG